ncbi:unnamed protein product [Rangifer tarandus platyrhynchus]|uniref:Uncharacterized protein n=1 Tax=Rangifer tarandus platyrhynchus TaxID=3082113 RepID=A0ABN8ZY50_RANTA|nr:unnamed protein product [Rangifer tarandus platyrhynchus]
MKGEKKALSVRKMNSESKVRRCAQGAEKGALAWGVRLAPLGIGERENTLPPLGIPFLWGRTQSPERSRYPRQAVATSNTGDFLPPTPTPSHGSPLGARRVQPSVPTGPLSPLPSALTPNSEASF